MHFINKDNIFHSCYRCTLLKRSHSTFVVNANITFHLYGECTLPTNICLHPCGGCLWSDGEEWPFKRRTTHLLPSGNLFSPNSISCRITACTAASTPQGPPCEWNHRPGIKTQLSTYNNNGHLERLTRTGPKCLHILQMDIFSRFSTHNMNTHTHTYTHFLSIHGKTFCFRKKRSIQFTPSPSDAA